MRFVVPLCMNCSTPLPPPASRGRPRRYCSARCRQTAHRRRVAATWQAKQDLRPLDLAELVPLDLDELLLAQYERAAPPLEGSLVDRKGTSDEQVLAAVIEAQGLAAAFRRLGREARPQFAFRCTELADSLDEALAEHFPTEDTKRAAGRRA